MVAMLHPDQLTLPGCFSDDRQHCEHRIKSYWGEKRGNPKKHLKTMLRSCGASFTFKHESCTDAAPVEAVKVLRTPAFSLISIGLCHRF